MQGLLNTVTAPAPAAQQPASTGFLADIRKQFKEGKFKTWARWLGVLNVIGTILLTFMLFSMMVPSGIFAIIIAIVVGILELPFCCTFLPICQKISSYMTFFEVYWIRGVLYIILGVLFFLIWYAMSGLLNLLYGPLYIVDGLLYLLAHCKGETHSAEDKSASSLGVDTMKLKTKVAAAAMGVV